MGSAKKPGREDGGRISRVELLPVFLPGMIYLLAGVADAAGVVAAGSGRTAAAGLVGVLALAGIGVICGPGRTGRVSGPF